MVENGYATYEDIDRACRNDMGYWITFAGPFQVYGPHGNPAYLSVMKDLFPELDNSTKPPAFIEELVTAGAKGVSNAHGFYPYTKKQRSNGKNYLLSSLAIYENCQKNIPKT